MSTKYTKKTVPNPEYPDNGVNLFSGSKPGDLINWTPNKAPEIFSFGPVKYEGILNQEYYLFSVETEQFEKKYCVKVQSGHWGRPKSNPFQALKSADLKNNDGFGTSGNGDGASSGWLKNMLDRTRKSREYQ